MRTTSRLFAAVNQSTSNYLTPHAPTGLTGIRTHPFPRPTLLYLYNSTLDKLSRLPSDSVYRQSTEALTKHRLAIVESTVPKGFEQWQKHVADEVLPAIESGNLKVIGHVKRLKIDGKPYLYQTYTEDMTDEREMEWDGERIYGDRGEGIRTEAERSNQLELLTEEGEAKEKSKGEKIANEPALTVDQISKLENEIGGGLIEEVIRVAQRERSLVDIMVENKVWEELAEKPREGQWDYFQRDKAVLHSSTP